MIYLAYLNTKYILIHQNHAFRYDSLENIAFFVLLCAIIYFA